MLDLTRRWVNGILFVVFILLVPFGLITYLYISAQTDYLIQRKFRLLALQSEQLKSTIENYTQRRLPNAVSAIESTYAVTKGRPDTERESLTPGREETGVSTELRRSLLVNLDLGDLDLIGEPPLPRAEKGEIRTCMDLQGWQEGDSFRLRFSYDGPAGSGTSGYRVKYEATAHVDRFLQSSIQGVFDQLVLLDEQGHTLFQKQTAKGPTESQALRQVIHGPSLTGASILDFSNLLKNTDSNPPGAAGASKSAGYPFGEFSQLHTTSLAGTEYKVFFYPLRIAIYGPTIKISNAAECHPFLNWTVVGLIRSDRFRAEGFTISYTLIMFFLLLLVLAVLSWPFLKIWSMAPRDRLHTGDVLTLTISVMIANALISLYLFGLYSYPRLEASLDECLLSLASEVRENYNRELDKTSALFASLPRNPAPPVKGSVLSAPHTPPGWRSWPFFESIIWIGKDGLQRAKWALRPSPTPLISVRERVYFQNVMAGRTWLQKFAAQPGSGKAGPGKTERSFDYWLEPIQSWNTGESLAVIASPLPDGEVLCMTAKLETLRGAVLPAGFGFLLVENNGNVIFHSEADHPRENLVEECENDRELKAVLFAHTREFLSVHYLGRGHRFYVEPLEGLPWSLVVYRDKELLRSANLEILSVAFALHLVYGFFILMPCIMLLLWKSEAVWPKAVRPEVHQQLVLGYLMMGLLIALAIWKFEPSDSFFTALVIPPIALLMTHWRLAGVKSRKGAQVGVLLSSSVLFGAWLSISQRWYRPWLVLLGVVLVVAFTLNASILARIRHIWRSGRRRACLPALGALLAVTGLMPALSFYAISYNAETRRFVSHAQISLLRSLLARTDRLNSEYQEPFVPQGFLEARWASESDIYDRFLFDTRHEGLLKAGTIVRSGRLMRPSFIGSPSERAMESGQVERLLGRLRPLYNETAAETHELAGEGSSDGTLWWTAENRTLKLMGRLAGAGDVALLESTLPGWDPPWDRPAWFLLLAVIAAICVAMPYFSAWFMERYVFFLDFEEPLQPVSVSLSLKKVTRNTMIFGPPFSGKSRVLENSGIPIRDLRAISQNPDWLAAMELEKIPKESPLAIDHLDYDMENAETNRKKLELFEKLLGENRTIVAVSSVDPMNFDFHSSKEKATGAKGDEQSARLLLDRWAGVLSVFTREVHGDEQRAREFHDRLETVRRTGTAPPEVVNALERECRQLPYLQRIGIALLDEIGSFAGPAQVVSELLDRTNPYYRALWAASSRDEKIALLDLAQDGYLNCKNTGIRSLMQRGLLMIKPNARLLNESFRRFVLDLGEQRTELASVEERGKWMTLRWILLAIVVGVLFILFFTQRGFFDNVMLFLGAIGGGTAAFFKLLDIFRGNRPSS